MSKKWIRIIVAFFLVLLPVALHEIYTIWTALPSLVTIATGPPGGLYKQLSENLAHEIRLQLGLTVDTVTTSGSLTNLRLLQSGNVDFALYQPGTLDVLLKHDPDFAKDAGLQIHTLGDEHVAFAANLYSQPAHFIVRRGAGIQCPGDLVDKTVSLGLKRSGDYSMGLVLLDHFNLNGKIHIQNLNYQEVLQGFNKGTIDAAFITVGTHAPIFRRLAESGTCDFIDIPHYRALEKNYLFTYPYEIPASLYSYLPHSSPATNIKTIAAGAQLLTRTGVNANLVRKVVEIIMDEKFMMENQLEELFAEGRTFSLRKPAYPLHQGAANFYNPELRPLLPPDFVEGTEGIRSFVVSFFIAVYFGLRSLRERRIRKKEHRLDKYMRSLLNIERKQVELDGEGDASDIKKLQILLDEITFLRQDALQEFSANQLKEDRAADCFIQMCHALSNKINAKISRQHLQTLLTELIEEVKKSHQSNIKENLGEQS